MLRLQLRKALKKDGPKRWRAQDGAEGTLVRSDGPGPALAPARLRHVTANQFPEGGAAKCR